MYLVSIYSSKIVQGLSNLLHRWHLLPCHTSELMCISTITALYNVIVCNRISRLKCHGDRFVRGETMHPASSLFWSSVLSSVCWPPQLLHLPLQFPSSNLLFVAHKQQPFSSVSIFPCPSPHYSFHLRSRNVCVHMTRLTYISTPVGVSQTTFIHSSITTFAGFHMYK